MNTDRNMTASEQVPLVVDVDRTLVSTDLLWEGLVRIAFHRPGRVPGVLGALVRGRAAFKREVALAADLDLDRIPLRSEVTRLIREARDQGRPIILASAAHREQVASLARRVGADSVLASDGETNLGGDRKLEALRRRTELFDYVGDAPRDLPLLREARRAYLVDPGATLRRLAEDREGVTTLETRSWPSRLRAWTRALRPHQWAKNGLLVLPILAAQLTWNRSLVVHVASGLVAFSFLASAVYLANDLADLARDRRHPAKRRRPLAAGELSIPGGLVTIAGLLLASALLSIQLPLLFQVALLVYLLLNVGYSWGLKELVVLDVVLLAALYTIRIVAGAALVRVELTSWFLAFAVFFFFSLAVLKRVIELDGSRESSAGRPPPGRSYSVSDLPVLLAVGPPSGLLSGVVYCLYITGPVRELYDRPELLWMGLPLFLYWIVRVWLLALRGEVDEDPVVFVLRDGPSYAVLLAFLLVVYLAA